MPLLQLKPPHSAHAFLGVWLYLPAPGQQMHDLLNLMRADPDVRVLWHGPLAGVPEFRARHWVERQTDPNGEPGGGFRNYRQAQGTNGFPRAATAKESVRTAVERLVSDKIRTVDAEIVVVRLIGGFS